MARDLERMMLGAGLVGRGASCAAASRALGVNEKTVRRWRDVPAFRGEVERVRSDLTPSPKGVFLAALTATKGDGIDWQARLRAADALLDLEGQPGIQGADVDAAVLEEWT
jgi:hypothetical protein